MKKSFIITLIVLIVVLASTNVFLLSGYNKCDCKDHKEGNTNCKCFVTEKLSLTDKQSNKYEAIKLNHQKIASSITDSLHFTQEMMMDYLESGEKDSTIIDEFETRLSSYQKQLLHQSISQYLELKEILDKNQVAPANQLFRKIFVCRPSCNHRESCQTHNH